MKLSTKCRYGVRAIIEIARSYGKGPVKRLQIAKKQHISKSYLENILIILKNSGLIDTVRGALGGYSLAKAPASIRVLDVVNALEGSIEPVECVGNTKACNRSADCLSRGVWKKLHEAHEKVLGSITLGNLLEQEGRNNVTDYTI
jgi:Rrf2 family protein